MELPEELNFLTKLRFWSMVIASLSLYAKTKGWIGDAETVLIASISGGFWITSTVDRNIGDKKVEASKIEAGFPPKEASKVL